MAIKRIYPFLKASTPKPSALDQYYGELTTLGTSGLYEILDQGKQWSKELATVLSRGGGAIFPHTYVSKCGYQIAAVIHGILESGADQVLILGTAHPFTAESLEARSKELNKEDISNEVTWGIINPESDKGYLLEKEFSLDLFKALWNLEIERRGVRTPKLIERYPSLANRKPELLPGIQKLKELSKNSVIVGTEDYCHHGVAYGIAKKDSIPMNERGMAFARSKIEAGFSMLMKSDYDSYFDHWMDPLAIGDPSDVTVVMHYLVGKSAFPKILDLKLVDVSPLFEGEPSPSWVATTLVSM